MQNRSHIFAFSLIELLTVMAVMGIMVGVAIPAVSGFGSAYKRKQTTSLVMNTLDQARVAALRSGENVHVIFVRPPDGVDAMIVVGDQPLGSGQSDSVLHTRWIKLPEGIRFRGAVDTVAGGDLPHAVKASFNDLQRQWGQTYSGLPSSAYFGVTFNSAGQVEFPSTGNLTLGIYEGTRSAGGAESAAGATAQSTQNLSESGLYEVIRLSRFTGRPRLDVASLQ
jgi:prepilin-type N-terminal cleavage/methylation domain-containing protein